MKKRTRLLQRASYRGHRCQAGDSITIYTSCAILSSMSDIITSTSNPTVRRLRKLATSSKARREEGRAIASGAHLVRSFLDTGDTPELCIIATAAQANEEVIELVRQLQHTDTTLMELADTVYESIADVHAAVGISIVFAIPETAHAALTGDALLVEDVQDPGNLGTMLRTAAASGLADVHLSPDCASAWSPKALRAGMGAQFALHIYEQSNLQQLIESSRTPVYATMLTGDSVDLYSLDLSTPTAWLVGNEGQGVSTELATLATQRVHIPQADTPVESLNVAAATAVCLYEQFRQRHMTS